MKEMVKETYISPEMELIVLAEDDIVTFSTPEDPLGQNDEEE